MPGAETDPYAVLGVPRSAREQEIRAAYRVLAARYHPDRHQGNPLKELANAKMAEINGAYAILSDPARRAAFDAGRGSFAGAAVSSSTHSRAPSVRPRVRARTGKLIALLLALPFILRLGAPVVRVLAILVRGLFEALAMLRGTPFVAVAVLLAMIVLGGAFFRSRRSKAQAGAKPGAPSERSSTS